MLRGPYLYAPPGQLLNPAHKQMLADAGCRLRSKSTINAYQSTWRQLQRRHPDFRITDFTEQHLVDFIGTDDAGRPRRPGDDGYREWTVLGHINAICSLFGWAFKRNMIADDPSKNLREIFGWVKPRGHRRHTWLKLPEVKTLLDACPVDTPVGVRDQIVLTFMCGTGARAEETSDIRWGHVDLGTPEVVIDHGKGNKQRYVPIGQELLLPALERWQQIVERETGRVALPSDPVFPRTRNMLGMQPTVQWHVPLGYSGLRDLVERAGVRIGRPALRPHDLRRSYAGILEDAGVPIQQISSNLGHESVDTTIRYLSNNPSKRAKSVAGVGL